VPLARLALAGLATAAAVALTGCAQDPVANDNPFQLNTDRTAVEPTIIRTPVRVDGDVPAVVPLPGPKGGPQGEAQGQGVETAEQDDE
jgi:poly(3-hydroxybutyrate) depolymerase